MKRNISRTSYGDFITAIREVSGLAKPLPDVYDTADVIFACSECRVSCNKDACAHHRRIFGL